MTRPRIEFLQSQWLPWNAEPLAKARPGVEARTLSRDPETGACSLLLRYPAGWRRPGLEHLLVDEEFLVLDGSLTVGRFTYGEKGYAHLPVHAVRDGMAAGDTGAIVLTFFSATPAVASGAPTTQADPARLVEGLDTYAVPYTGNFHPEFPPGAGRKKLYDDPVTGDQSWILGTLGMRWAERAETHPTVEEMYLLAGEVHGNLGIMRPGAYFWRPPRIAHGPYGSKTGNIYFFRTKGGKLSTVYEDAARPFQWDPAFAPVLPAELKAYASEAPPAPRPW
jgi:hypothetical protein